MNTSIKKQTIELTQQSPNQEICGLFYTNFDTVNFYQCKNISINPHNTFEISNEDFIKVENMGDIKGIFHSHVNEDSEFSENDINLSNEIDLPIFCYSDLDKKYREYRPKDYKISLYPRQFIWGQNDCYSLIRDYYWNNFNILLDDFDRDEFFDKENPSVIIDNFQNQGFYEPENTIDIQEHDLIVYKSIKHAYPDHLEVFIGNSRVLSHLMNRLSSKEMIQEGIFKKRYKIFRYKDLSQKRNISFC